MRVYLVIMDETEEAVRALRFASRRAMKTGGAVQATIEEEAYDRAEMVASSAAGSIFAESGKMPVISVRTGDAQGVIREYLAEHPEVAALVLGTAKEGGPGPLVSHFSAHAGALPCPLFLVPGGISDEDLDRLS
jgi:hypothetical protein